MKGLEYSSQDELIIQEFEVDFGMDGFDINSAFQEAVSNVLSDKDIKLDEKIRRMETIVIEGTSDIYREFIDFRQIVSQIEMICNHDHVLESSMRDNETVSDFMHNHADEASHDHEDEYEIDHKTGKKTKKKKKKKRSWLENFVQNH